MLYAYALCIVYLPSRATNKLAKQSDTLVPAARMVNPITVSAMPSASPVNRSPKHILCIVRS